MENEKKFSIWKLLILRIIPLGFIFGILLKIYQHWPALGLHLLLCYFVAVPLCFVPFFICRWLGKYKFFEANAISIWRVPIGLMAFPFFFEGWRILPQHVFINWLGHNTSLSLSQMIGLILVTASIALDRTDGRFAEANKHRRTNEQKELGAWLDPLCDKLTIISMFAYLSVIMSMLSIWGILAKTLFDGVGTLARPPLLKSRPLSDYDTDKSFKCLLESHLKNKGKASSVGKIKFVSDTLVLLVILFKELYQVNPPNFLNPNQVLWLAVIFAFLSPLSRFKIFATVDAIVDWGTNRVFNHEDI